MATWERVAEKLWRGDPKLSELLDAALAQGTVLPSGDVDISEYLRSIERPWPEEGARILSGSECDPSWMCCFIRGDANRDWQVNISDPTYILQYLFQGGPAPDSFDSADADDSGAINETDATYLFAYLFYSGPEPPAPFPTAGVDPSYDPMELPCGDLGDFEHARNALEEAEIVLAPSEDPGFPGDMLPDGPTEPIDGTGGFGGLSPDLPVFPGPGGLAWGFRPSYRTRYPKRGNEAEPFEFETEAGKGWFSSIPHIVDAGPGAQPARYWIRWSASCVRAYAEGEIECPPRFSTVNRTTLIRDAQANEFRLYDLAGRTYVFFGYGPSAGPAKGRLKRVEGIGGVVVGATIQKPRIELGWYEDTGELHQVQLLYVPEGGQSATTAQRWVYEYSGGGKASRIVRVSLERPTLPEHIRVPYEVTLRYWYPSDSSEHGGTDGDLMQVDAKTDLSPIANDQAPQTVTKTWYYRYYTASWSLENTGYPHQVRHFLGPDAAAELNAASYKTADVSGVADRTYEYCQDRRVRSLKLRGISCGGCGNQGSYTYGWALEKAQSAAAPNESHIRVHIQLPHEESVDSVRRILIYNAYGQKLVDARCVRETPGSPELSWVDGAKYGTIDEAWCLRHRFWPSAMQAFTPGNVLECLTEPAPPFQDDGDIQGYQVSDTTGKRIEYCYTWEAQSPTFKLETLLGQGQTPGLPMSGVTMELLPGPAPRKRAVLKELREYEAEQTCRATTFSDFEAHAEDPLALKRYTKTYPAVSQEKNGSDSSASETFGEDRLGMVRWHVDAAGRIHYREYDPVIWEVSTFIEDANLTWENFLPPSDAIHAVTNYAYDALGRLVRTESPAGLADNNQTELRSVERRVYARLGGPSEKLSADRPAILIYQHVENDLAQGQTATPKGEVSISVSTPGGRAHASGSAFLPPGTAPYFYLGHWDWSDPPAARSLDEIFAPRAYCHLLERREYVYSHDAADDHLITDEWVWTEPESSSAAEDYKITRHDNPRGLPWKVVGPCTTGGCGEGGSGFREVQETSYDPLGRPVAWSVGSEGGSDMVVVRRVAYDGAEPGGPLVVGDGHLTSSVEYPGDGTAPRWTRYDVDYRGLTERVWHGYDPPSATAIAIAEYVRDYRGRVIEETRYATSLTLENRRALSKTLYDERGRVYETQTYGVTDQGTVIGDPEADDGDPIPLRTRTWYDARGRVLKRQAPDSTFRKYRYDGLGPEIQEYFGFDVDEATYEEARTDTGDTVVEQWRRKLDKAGNVLYLVTCKRFSTAPSNLYGDLESASDRRREYRAFWYDVLGRLEVEGFYGDFRDSGTWNDRPTSRPTATTNQVLVTKRSYPETLSGGTRRWSTFTEVDGGVLGTELDALGRAVRSWRKSRTSARYRVSEAAYDPSGHAVAETVYQNELESGYWPPVFPGLSNAKPCTTAYDWGLKRETSGPDWSRNLLSSTDLLAGVRRPDPKSGTPVANRVARYAYNALGELRAEFRFWGSQTVGRKITRDALGRKVSDEVAQAPPELPGPEALEWEYDSRGRLARARVFGENTILNELAYTYDPWGAMSEMQREHWGEVSPSSSGFAVEYEGPKVVGSGSDRHAIAHRPRYLRLKKPEVFASISYNYGNPGSLSSVLARPSYEAAALSGGEESTWGPAWRVQETFLGLRRWVKGGYQKKSAGGSWTTQLTEEIPSPGSLNSSGGFDRFGRPVKFRAQKDSQNIPLFRSYSYDASTARLVQSEDKKTVSGASTTLARETLGYDSYGRVVSFTHDPLGNPDGGIQAQRTWTLDAVSNWTQFSLDGQGLSRTYNRRNEIAAIGGYDVVDYDEAGRITGHHYHGVNAEFYHDAWDRLVRYEPVGGSVAVEFHYDALGALVARLERQIGSGPPESEKGISEALSEPILSETRYYYDPWGRRLWRANGQTGAIERIYFTALGSGRPWGLVASSTHYYVADPWGERAGLTSDQGAIEARYWYDGTGEPIQWAEYSQYLDLNDLWRSSAQYEFAIRALLPPFGGWISAVLGENMEGTIGADRTENRKTVDLTESEWPSGPFDLEKYPIEEPDYIPGYSPESDACCVTHDVSFVREGPLLHVKKITDYIPVEEQKIIAGRPKTRRIGLTPPEESQADQRRRRPPWWVDARKAGRLEVDGHWLVQMNCRALSCRLDGSKGSCGIEQFAKVVDGTQSFLRSVSRARGRTVEKGKRFPEEPIVYKGCFNGFLSMIDAPGGFHGKGLIEFETSFKSGDQKGCYFKGCTVAWTYHQWGPVGMQVAYHDVDWNYISCERWDGVVFRKKNPSPKAPNAHKPTKFSE